MSQTVLIRGESIAASCCASLLARAGVLLCRERIARPKLPAIMLSATTQRVMTDIFHEADLFRGMPPIRKRVVKWKPDAPTLALPHSSIVVSEEVLLGRMEDALADWPKRERAADTAVLDWSLLSARPLPEGSEEFHFGERMGAASAVKMKDGCDGEAAWVESLSNGWLFLIPDGGGGGWLLCVGGSPDALLGESSVICGQIRKVDADGKSFPCHPRIADPICGRDWLACGSAAMGFDPLCGDGSGHAAREAILAAAVMRAAMQGEPVEALCAHYQARLVAGFEKHLRVCWEFYRSGGVGEWWEKQVKDTEAGLKWCGEKRAAGGAFQYRLNGFALERVGG